MPLEIVMVFSVLLAMASVGTPGINETHYLTKAKHFWNPDWCSQDLFLQSANAHWAFYVLMGWPTLFLSLDTFAWCGRIATWLAFSCAWVNLNRVLRVQLGWSPLSAALFVLLTRRFDMAGEWVVGGFEAKSVAYVFVVAAVGQFLCFRWNRFCIFLGIAILFHAVVGIWASCCFLFASLVARLLFPGEAPVVPTAPTVQTWLSRALFVVLVLMGSLPALLTTTQVAGAELAHAYEIQVHMRLAHHLLFGHFSAMHVFRFSILTLAWLTLTQFTKQDAALRRWHLFCGGSLLISLSGVFLSGLTEGEAGSTSQNWANAMLRFYWFRFSDFAMPLGVSILGIRLGCPMLNSGSPIQRALTGLSFVAIIGAGLLATTENYTDTRSPADQASLPSYVNTPHRTEQTADNWIYVCDWIQQNTKPDSLFLTPHRQQTFKWYAHRAEVACWKDAPQDAEGLLRWYRRIEQLRFIEENDPTGVFMLEPEQIEALVKRYGITHFLVPQAAEDAARASPLGSTPLSERWQRLYPDRREDRTTYVVYRWLGSDDVSRE